MSLTGNLTSSPNLKQHVDDKNNPHGVTAAQVGALPLNSWQAATDFNTLTESGIYQCQGVNLNTPYGSDTDTHFFVMVFRSSDQWMRQVAYDVRTQNCYTRVKCNDTWYSWQQIMLGSDVTTLLAAKQDASTAINIGNIGNYAATKEYVDSKASVAFKVASVTQSLTISSSYKNLGYHEVSDFVLTVPNSASIIGISIMAVNCNIQYVNVFDNGYQWDSGTDTLRVHAHWIGATNQSWTQTFECKVIYM